MKGPGAGDDASNDSCWQCCSVETLSDHNKDISDHGGDDKNENEGLTDSPICAETQIAVEAMLEELCQRRAGEPGMESVDMGMAGKPSSAADQALNLWNDHAALHTANLKLTEKCKEKKLDLMLQAQIVAMTGALNLWTNTSLVVAKAQEQGVTHACNLHKWILDFV